MNGPARSQASWVTAQRFSQRTIFCRESQRKAQGGGGSLDAIPAVTHVRLKMKGGPGSRPGGALSIYDVAINARDPSARQEPKQGRRP